MAQARGAVTHTTSGTCGAMRESTGTSGRAGDLQLVRLTSSTLDHTCLPLADLVWTFNV